MKEKVKLEIIIKFLAQGYDCGQEVDNICSLIEKNLKKSEVFSINKLSEIIKSAKRRNSFIVIEMKSEDSNILCF